MKTCGDQLTSSAHSADMFDAQGNPLCSQDYHLAADCECVRFGSTGLGMGSRSRVRMCHVRSSNRTLHHWALKKNSNSPTHRHRPPTQQPQRSHHHQRRRACSLAQTRSRPLTTKDGDPRGGVSMTPWHRLLGRLMTMCSIRCSQIHLTVVWKITCSDCFERWRTQLGSYGISSRKSKNSKHR